jgi:Tfp pilus tip-associated adhesin PilY1
MLGCSPAHQQMQSASAQVTVLQKFKPAFTVALYNTTVDVMGNHLSGLLLIKKMPDSSTRMVFSNEMGLGFFDFEFAADGTFKVHSIMKKLNKKTNEGLTYFIFPQSKGFNYYITTQSGDELVRMERASSKKTIVEAVMKNYINGIPDTIGISHKTFEFNIGLKRIER